MLDLAVPSTLLARADKLIEYKAGFAALHMSACDAVDGPPARLCGGRAAVAPPGMDRGVVLPAPTFGREVLADLLKCVQPSVSRPVESAGFVGRPPAESPQPL